MLKYLHNKKKYADPKSRERERESTLLPARGSQKIRHPTLVVFGLISNVKNPLYFKYNGFFYFSNL